MKRSRHAVDVKPDRRGTVMMDLTIDTCDTLTQEEIPGKFLITRAVDLDLVIWSMDRKTSTTVVATTLHDLDRDLKVD